MKNYIVREIESGTEIEDFDTLKEAIEAIQHFESEDRKQEMYEKNFYEVYSILEQSTVPTF